MKITKKTLDELYTTYSVSTFIDDDPVQFVYQFQDHRDREMVAFIVSTLAFGHRPQIIKFIPRVLNHLGQSPYQSILEYKINNISSLNKLIYRFIKGSDLNILFYCLHQILQDYSSLEELFAEGYKKDKSIYSSISHVVDTINSIPLPKPLLNKLKTRERNFKFLLPHPNGKSACKRMHLFLKWMIRKDAVDLGLWTTIPQDKLIIPLDTHVARMSKMLKLTTRKQVDWNMAVEITEKLKKWDKNDPVKYDFSLFGMGLHYNETGIPFVK